MKQEEDKMSYYSSPEEMYTIKSAKYKKEGDRYWAKAKSGESGYYYKKARNQQYNRYPFLIFHKSNHYNSGASH